MGRIDEHRNRLMLWVMVTGGPSSWSFIPAEAPCWKGEVNASFRWFGITIGWQRKPREAMRENL